MRRQLVLIISLGLNGCLLILLLSMLSHSRQSAQPSSAPQTVVSNSVRNHVIVRRQFFLWEELESTDYSAYISNLTAIECPPQTIRDIILAEVNQAYLFRRLTEIKDPLADWWRSFPDTNTVAENRRQRLQMESQRRDMLDGLLAANWETALLPAQFTVCMTGPTLGAVSPENKRKVLEILQRAAQRKTTYELSLGISAADAVDAGYAILNRSAEQELTALLTPAEMEEYLLRYSDVAAGLRDDFKEIEIQRDEFLRAFRLVFPLRRQMLAIKGDSPEDISKASDLQYRINEAIKGILGLSRFQAYLARTDLAYRLAVQDAAFYHGSPKTVQALYRSLQTLTTEEQKVINDSSLSDAEKQDKIAALREQQLEARNQILDSDSTTTNNTSPPVPPQPDPVQYQTHPYSPGETIDQIAAEFGVRPSDILKANPDLNFQALQKSTPIRIPVPNR